MTSSLPVLYSFRRCPYAIRARLALAAAGIRCELREVKLASKPRAMLAISPKGTVPVLQLTDGTVIDESLELMLWALERADPEGWLGVEPRLTRDLIRENDDKFKADLDRYKYFVRYPEYSQAHYRGKAEKYIRKLEDRLNAVRGRGLVSPGLSLADFAIFPFVRQFSRVDLEWFEHSGYEKTLNWLNELESLPLFQRVMNKYEPWQETLGNSYVFPD